jgi:predicted dehydrogenase
MAEKPIAFNEREAAEIERVAAQSGVCYMSGYLFGFSMGRYVHETLEAGAAGEIQSITGSIGTGPLDDGWIAHPETGGGPLLFVGCHLVDLFLWFLADEPVMVYADVRWRADTGADETSAFQIRFANGALAQGFVTQAASTSFYEVDVHGTGKITLRGRNFLQFEIEVSSSAIAAHAEPTIVRPDIRRDNITMMLAPELEEFAGAIREQRPPAIIVANGRSVLKVLDAIVSSGRSGQPITLSN